MLGTLVTKTVRLPEGVAQVGSKILRRCPEDTTHASALDSMSRVLVIQEEKSNRGSVRDRLISCLSVKDGERHAYIL